MKRAVVFLLLGIFGAAFAVHPIVHVEDGGAHVCLLTTTAPDRVFVPPVITQPGVRFVGRSAAVRFMFERSGWIPPRDARAPPLSLQLIRHFH